MNPCRGCLLAALVSVAIGCVGKPSSLELPPPDGATAALDALEGSEKGDGDSENPPDAAPAEVSYANADPSPMVKQVAIPLSDASGCPQGSNHLFRRYFQWSGGMGGGHAYRKCWLASLSNGQVWTTTADPTGSPLLWLLDPGGEPKEVWAPVAPPAVDGSSQPFASEALVFSTAPSRRFAQWGIKLNKSDWSTDPSNLMVVAEWVDGLPFTTTIARSKLAVPVWNAAVITLGTADSEGGLALAGHFNAQLWRYAPGLNYVSNLAFSSLTEPPDAVPADIVAVADGYGYLLVVDSGLTWSVLKFDSESKTVWQTGLDAKPNWGAASIHMDAGELHITLTPYQSPHVNPDPLMRFYNIDPSNGAVTRKALWTVPCASCIGDGGRGGAAAWRDNRGPVAIWGEDPVSPGFPPERDAIAAFDKWGNLQWTRKLLDHHKLIEMDAATDGTLLVAGLAPWPAGYTSVDPLLYNELQDIVVARLDPWGHDVCDAGVCASLPVTACDDGNDCTADDCDPKTGCLHLKLADGATCADDGKHCKAGKCVK